MSKGVRKQSTELGLEGFSFWSKGKHFNMSSAILTAELWWILCISGCKMFTSQGRPVSIFFFFKSLSKLWEIGKHRHAEAWHDAAFHGVTKNWTQFSYWPTTKVWYKKKKKKQSCRTKSNIPYAIFCEEISWSLNLNAYSKKWKISSIKHFLKD